MIFPQEFFNEEVRDDFTVAEMMKRAWAAAVEVLEVIADVCARNGLKYYAYGGTLLGAIRHKGFIPWDDDIDICMLRADYDRFFEIADSQLPEGFVISGIYAKEPRLVAANKEPQGRVIADETLFPLPKYMDRFHGYPYMRIGIDIFPLDYLPEKPEDQYEHVMLINRMQTTARFYDVYKKDGSLIPRIRSFNKYLDGILYDPQSDEEIIRAIWYASDRIAASVAPTNKVFDVLYLSERSRFSDTDGFVGVDPKGLGEGQEVPFECFTIRIPDNYDDVLKAEFGPDYMTPVKFAGDHEYPFYKSQEAAFAGLLKESGIDTPIDEFCRNWHRMNGGT